MIQDDPLNKYKEIYMQKTVKNKKTQNQFKKSATKNVKLKMSSQKCEDYLSL